MRSRRLAARGSGAIQRSNRRLRVGVGRAGDRLRAVVLREDGGAWLFYNGNERGRTGFGYAELKSAGVRAISHR
jgi:hypothetical protein